MKNRFSYTVSPGSIGLLSVIISLLGENSVYDSGSWTHPITITCTQSEAETLEEILEEAYPEIGFVVKRARL